MWLTVHWKRHLRIKHTNKQVNFWQCYIETRGSHSSGKKVHSVQCTLPKRAETLNTVAVHWKFVLWIVITSWRMHYFNWSAFRFLSANEEDFWSCDVCFLGRNVYFTVQPHWHAVWKIIGECCWIHYGRRYRQHLDNWIQNFPARIWVWWTAV